jgi:hypothetical protein
MSHLSNYPAGVTAWDINHLCQENFPDTCPSCGGEIADPSYLLTDGPSVDICGEVYHANCAAEMLAETLIDEEMEACV